MSEPKELERLQTLRAELETESRSLKEEQKNLEDSMIILEERIAVEELKNSNKATKDAISQLEARKSGLETKLKQVLQIPEASTPAEEMAPEATAPSEKTEEALEPAEATPEEFEEDIVTVTAIDDESLAQDQEEFGENIKKQQEKKKRRLF
jgi:hypothetical protein